MTDKTYRIDPLRCPHCDHDVDSATQTDENPEGAPEDGDFALCIGCGEWGIYQGTPPTEIRRPTLAEWTLIGMDPNCSRARRAWLMTVGSVRATR
jgi:hypothetical protein